MLADKLLSIVEEQLRAGRQVGRREDADAVLAVHELDDRLAIGARAAVVDEALQVAVAEAVDGHLVVQVEEERHLERVIRFGASGRFRVADDLTHVLGDERAAGDRLCDECAEADVGRVR